jgi:hypothetical protein
MALDPRALAKVIEIINSREKGGEPVKEYKGGVSKTPTGRSNAFSYGSGLEDYMKEAQEKGLDVSNLKSAEDLQGRIYDSLMSSREGQGVLKNMWRNYGDTMKGSGKVLPENMTEQDLAGLRSSFADNMLGARTQMVLAGLNPSRPQQAPEPTPQQRQYEGEPVYLPGVQGATGGPITNALVGFLNQKGEYSPISSEDYKRYAVPSWAQEQMSKGFDEQFIKSKIGGYYKGIKK